MDADKLCRICLKQPDCLIPLFYSSPLYDDNFCVLLEYCLNEEVKPVDNFPENICEGCANELINFSHFKKKYYENNIRLVDLFSKPNVVSDGFEQNNVGVNLCNNNDHDYLRHEDQDNYVEQYNVLKEKNEVTEEDREEDIIATEDEEEIVKEDSMITEIGVENNIEVVDLHKIDKYVRIKNHIMNLTDCELFCKWCGLEFVVYVDYYNHVLNHYMDDCEHCYSPTDFKPEDCDHALRQYFNCLFCGEIYSEKIDYNSHLKEHFKSKCEHDEVRDQCDHCFNEIIKFSRNWNDLVMCVECHNLFDESAINSHLKDEHDTCEHLENVKNVCALCIKCTEKPKKFECPICSLSYRTKYYLKFHLRKHRNEKKFKCDFCGASFLLKQYLTDHLEIHVPGHYPCNICKKIFTRKSKLKRHKYVHITKRNYICNVCDKGFKLRAHLNVHMVVHSSEKQYSCSICNVKFGMKGSLTKHMSRKHKDVVESNDEEKNEIEKIEERKKKVIKK